jgi:hypothetical protein
VGVVQPGVTASVQEAPPGAEPTRGVARGHVGVEDDPVHAVIAPFQQRLVPPAQVVPGRHGAPSSRAARVRPTDMIAPAPPAHQGLGPLWPPELSSPGAPRRTEPAVGVSSRRRLGPGAKLVPTDATVQELVGQGCQGAKSEDTEASPPSAPRPASTFRADAGAGAPQRPLDAPGGPSTPTIRGSEKLVPSSPGRTSRPTPPPSRQAATGSHRRPPAPVAAPAGAPLSPPDPSRRLLPRGPKGPGRPKAERGKRKTGREG